MDRTEYLVAFYSIIFGFACYTYVSGWSHLFLTRKRSKNYWIPLVWSVSYFAGLINEWFTQYRFWNDVESAPEFLLILLSLFAMHFIGFIILPESDTEDYFERFLENKKVIILLTLFVLVLKIDFNELTFFRRTHQEILFLLALFIPAIFTNKKVPLSIIGLVLLSFWVYRMTVLSIA